MSIEEGCTATYTPVVSGLKEVEVETGEEDQELVYSHLCLLYRFDPNDSSWKGRGRGDVKVLRHHTTGECRLVLREDKTFKLRLNTPIFKEVDLSLMSGSDRAYSWVCKDYSEGNEEGVSVTAAVKFKTPEIAEEFKAAYELCRSGEAPQDAPQGTAMTSAEAQAFIEAVEAAEDPASVIDAYVEKHGINTLSEDGFTLLMYVVGATNNLAAAELLTKKAGAKLNTLCTGTVYNFEFEERYLLHGLHSEDYKDEMEVFDTGMTALHLAALSAQKPLFSAMFSCKFNSKLRTKKGRDLRDCIKNRYDSDGGKHDLTKMIQPKEVKPTPKPIEASKVLSNTSEKKEETAAATPAPKEETQATGAAGFTFSSAPSFNFSWGKAAEEKKAAEDAEAVGNMTTDVKELQKQLLSEKKRADKAEQMLEDALLELQAIKQERKVLISDKEKLSTNLVSLMEQLGMGEGDFEGDDGYGEDEADDGEE
mmetsp:Transcript_43507/g.85169  ORF Transcript_43507/g.85169 Transcript_43507/m.85169 type:complete len:479 (-) Transcript_43507:284-1720(-)|eukprot:CAMPEP_0175146642 /NCGR_PEP_ID=MMETSP0087-20121206/15494_1 /TAXON_ID=136419 /ORGANISM="Unknown Unknown, Strain D1" /LENGTH=478 /DNA_ID=CAMNT_0016431631 /DNA_START=33 /DNA_END=1469 /DNA_ORIENTATION=+